VLAKVSSPFLEGRELEGRRFKIKIPPRVGDKGG
jgi:hypothetical protein